MSESDQSDLIYDIAIVGMAGRFPGARSVDEFWRNVRDGVEAITFFTEEELAEAGTSPALLKNPNYVRANGVLDDIEFFDAAFFGFSPREAEIMDPQQRLFLECAWEALESSGYDPQTYKKSIGVYAGTTRSSYINNIYSNPELAEALGTFQIGIGNDKDHLAPRVSYKLNLKGPSVTVQTACSTSLVAVSLACQNLLNFQCDMALAGGVSVSAVQKTGYMFMEGGINSPDGHCRAFDAEAKGCIGGNGVGVVLLKRLTDALADGDPIHAVIKGSAINNDGSVKVGYTAPSVEGQSAVIAEALAMAGISPETINYVEAHGTGTTLGDPIEIAALTKAYRTKTAKKNFCAIGSAKTNIGHLDAAAGVAGLIRATLALKHQQVPPSLNFTAPNPKIDFAGSPFFVSTTLSPWERNGTPRRAGVSSFGIGGTNAHVVLEEAPPVNVDHTQRPFQLLTLSARSEAALDDATQNLLEHLQQYPEQSLADVAYTLQVGRRAFTHRRAFVCSDNADAVRVLETQDPQRTVTPSAEPAPDRPVVFMFPGQGTQHIGMGEELYRHEPLFRQTVDRCCELLRAHLKLDLRDILYPTDENKIAAEAQLRQTSLTQPALFVTEYALAQLWISWDVRPRAMIGHSIGEYVAACVAGVISLEDALSLVAQRGAMMQGLDGGAMLAVPLCEQDVKEMLGAGLSLAAVNSPTLCVVSGEFEAITKLQSGLAEKGLECQLLRTSHAFHSRMMEPIVKSFAAEVGKVRLNAPSIPFVSNVTGTWISADEATSPAYWAKQLRQAVRFSDGLEELLKEKQSVLLEVGPGRTLDNLVKMHPSKTAEHVVVSSLRRPIETESDIALILKAAGRLWQAGIQLDWTKLHTGEQRRRLPLPTYPFERQRYWAERRKLPASAPATLQKKSDIADWLYAPSWKQSPAYRSNTEAVRETWLAFIDESGIGPSLAQRLADAGHEVIKVRAGQKFGRDDAGAYTVNPSCAEDYVALIGDLQRNGIALSSIVHLWSVGAVAEALAGEAAFEAAQARGFYSVLFLTQALDKQGITDPLRIVVVSSGVQSVTGEEQLCPEKATLLGLRNVIPQEYPNITCTNVDIVVPQARESQLIEQLVVELTMKRPDEVVAYRGSRRWVQSFEPVRLKTGESRLEGLRDRGVYMITGGLGGVSLVLAEHLARTVRARLVLIGRTSLPERSEWETWLASHDAHNSVSRKIAAVTRLEELGSEVLIVSADVSNEVQMRAALDQTLEHFGELHGVIHGAGISGPQSYRSISETGATEAGWHFQPKAHGLYVLQRVLEEQPLDFCLLLSSLSSVLGGLGFAAYSSANVFMDAFAHAQRETTGVPWISVNWDGWQLRDEPEMARKQIGAGVADLSINPAEGAEVLSRILAFNATSQIIVSTGDLQLRLDKWIKRKSLATSNTPAKASKRYARPQLKNEFAAARNELEQTIAEIWQDLLGIDQVGINDNFFELGGHSLLATQLISRLRKTIQVEIPLRLIFETHTLAALAENVAPLLDQEDALEIPSIVPVSREGELPLSFAQQRLWFLHQFEPDSNAYNMPIPLHLEGALEHAVLERTLNELVRRHEVLRTTFVTVDGQPLQVITPAQESHLPLVDLSELPEDVRRIEANRLAVEEARRPFDLSTGPLLRTTLVRLAAEEHFVLLTMHHIISDGWSMGVLTKEVALLYGAFSRGEDSPLPELPVQYADFAVWQRNWLTGEVLERHLDYWRKQLTGAPGLLELPTDRPRPPVQTHRGASHSVILAGELSERLNALSREHGTTLFMTLLAAFQTLLMRYTGQEDICTGTPVAGRDRLETEPLIGFFINTLVIRTDLGGDPAFNELLGRVREVVLGAQQHQNLPFEKLVDDLQVERSLDHTPLFQVLFVLQNAGQESLELPDVKLQSVGAGIRTVKFDLTLEVIESARNIRCVLEYNSDLFESATVKRMLGHLHTLVEAIAADPTARLSELPLLTDSDHQLLSSWNNTDCTDPGLDLRLHEHVELQVERTPGAIALIYEQEQLTYSELNVRANQLAHHLRSLGVDRESLVGVLMERSTEMVVALLAIVKAGAAYVPLDPSYPQERLSFMLADAGIEILLTQSHLSETLDASAEGHSFNTLYLDQLVVSEESTTNPQVAVEADNAAYMIYTSGSTGRPKGVVNTHRGIVNRLVWMQQQYQLTGTDRILQKTPFSFDVSVWEFFWPLMTGARLVVARPGGHMDANYLARIIHDQGVTTLHFVPSMLQVFLEEKEIEQCRSIRQVMSSGEALGVELEQRFFERMPWAELHNLYGPTEAAVDVSYWQCAPDSDRRSVPIGRPIANTQLYVLDKRMEPVAVGVHGEVYIGGVGLARGYKGRAELTAEKFVPNPFSERAGERLYRTGDVGRWLEGGEIEYIGRIDEQVKIRGFRIELGEIASVIREQTGVKDCVVIAREDQGEKRLVAYVVGEQGASRSELRAELKKRLPDYMIPSAIVTLEELPVTANGKLDRRALPAPGNDRSETQGVYVAPHTPEQEVLANIWSRVLRVDRVGLTDNFFELGGHSLLAMQLLSRVRDAFRVELPLRSLFESPTLGELAKTIEAATRAEQRLITAPIVPVPRDGELPLSYAQQQMWFLNQLEPESHLYNMHTGVRLAGALNTDALERTFTEIVRRHEVLRTSFRIGTGGRPVQIVEPPQPVKLVPFDLSELPAAEQEAQLRQLAQTEARKPFDLSQAPLLRVALVHLSEQDHVVLFTMHHIVGDAWSENVLRREIGQLYHAFSQDQPSPLAELPVQYADFAVWQKQWIESEVLEEQLSYWKQQLGDDPPVLELPLDRPRPAIQTFAGSSHEIILSESITKALKTLNREEGVTLFMTVLAAFQTLLHRYSGQDDIIVGSGIANRNRAETENLLGYFVNTLALRVDLSGNPTFRELLARVREVTLGAYAHQDMPFELLVEKLQPERTANRTPLFQVWCETQALDGQGGKGSAPVGLTMTSTKYVRRVAYFDLMLFLTETDKDIVGYLEFNTDLFDTDTVGEMTRRFITLMESVSANPDLRLLDIPLGQSETEELAGNASEDEDFFTFESTDAADSFTFETKTSAPAFEKSETALTTEAIRNIAAIPRISRNQNLPLSFAQQRLWFLHQLNPDSAVYNVPVSVRLKGTLDIQTLERSLSEVVRRHEILRTSFAFVDLEPVQIIEPAQPLRLPIIDLTLLPFAERENKASELISEEAHRPFDLAAGPLVRVILIRIDSHDHVVMLTLHHIVCDGWSLNVLMRDIAATYTAFAKGEPSPLPELPIQYADFAHWQRSWLREETLEAQLSYWHEQMADAPPVLELPLDRPRPAAQTFRGAIQSLVLSKSLSEKVHRLGKQENVTLFMLLLAAYKVLLYQYTLQEDIVVSTGVANRNRRDIENLIGLHVNTLLLRTNLYGNPTFREVLARVRDVTLGAYDHQDLPFEVLVEALQPERSPGVSPLFQTMFMLQNGSTAEESTQLPGLTMSTFGARGMLISKFDITLFVLESPDSLKAVFEYNTDLFNDSTIVQMLKYFEALLECIVANPDKEIDDISFMTPEESRQLIETWA
ncbi:MAG TPA: amino acid adenylation domain-containing protein [Pyrinomonadaceae bacterium]